jgi:hypothetical protein
MDVHSFANDGFYFADLPPSLHPQLRCLLSIRKHSQVLSPTAAGGGNTPREISPFHRRVIFNFNTWGLGGRGMRGIMCIFIFMGQISGKLDPLATYIRLYYPLPNHFSQNTPKRSTVIYKITFPFSTAEFSN